MVEKDIVFSDHRKHINSPIFQRSSIETVIGSGITVTKNGDLVHFGIDISRFEIPLHAIRRTYKNPIESENRETRSFVKYNEIKDLTKVSLIVSVIYEESNQRGISQNILFTPILESRRIGKSISFGRDTDQWDR
ncbi:MAG: hypothetical protein AAB546_00290 [Patescibacteria group bacterium]